MTQSEGSGAHAAQPPPIPPHHGQQSTGRRTAISLGLAAVLGVVGLTLAWAVATTTLPMAIAENSPERALWLNPETTRAHLELAREKRNAILAEKAARAQEQQDATTGAAATSSSPSQPLSPQQDVMPQTDAGMTAGLRQHLNHILANDPLNAAAFRMLGEMTDDTSTARRLMEQAAARSRRDSVAEFWLMNDAFVREEMHKSLTHADHLMLSKPRLEKYVIGYLARMAEREDAQPLLANRLAEYPRWRARFFSLFPSHVSVANVPLQLMTALDKLGERPSQSELRPYLDHLIANNFGDLAYYTWLQFAPKTVLSQTGLLYNGNFETEPNKTPFDWNIGVGRNSSAELVSRGDRPGNMALEARFYGAEVQMPRVRQTTALSPGRYKFRGAVFGRLRGRRGLSWQLVCAGPRGTLLLDTPPVLSSSGGRWQQFEVAFTVPQTPRCSGQHLQLRHPARSRSEQILEGQLMFDDLKIERVLTSQNGSAEPQL